MSVERDQDLEDFDQEREMGKLYGDAEHALPGRNAEAWGEVAAFLQYGHVVDIDPEPDGHADDEVPAEELEEINQAGEVADLDDDDIPEGYVKCDNCQHVLLEEEYTYESAVCDECIESGEEEEPY